MTRIVPATVLLALLLLAPPLPARACSVCGCGDPLLAASDPAAIGGNLRLQLDTEYLRVDAGTDGVPGSTDQLRQWSYRLNAVYRPLEALSLMVTVPLVTKTIDTVAAGLRQRGDGLTGLGDVEVAARWTAWRGVNLGARRASELAIAAGTMLPTGSHDARDGAGGLLDPHAQLGTGSWGPFVGLNYLFEQGDWLGYANASVRHRTEATFFDASRYQFGDALLWSVHGQHRILRRVALDLGLDARHARVDRAAESSGIAAGDVENTGGTVIAVAPGAYLDVGGGFWVFLRGQVPVVKRLTGEQDVLPSFTTGVQLQVF